MADALHDLGAAGVARLEQAARLLHPPACQVRQGRLLDELPEPPYFGAGPVSLVKLTSQRPEFLTISMRWQSLECHFT
jgi:hypothetical protein